jgi:hypothetical protein
MLCATLHLSLLVEKRLDQARHIVTVTCIQKLIAEMAQQTARQACDKNGMWQIFKLEVMGNASAGELISQHTQHLQQHSTPCHWEG